MVTIFTIIQQACYQHFKWTSTTVLPLKQSISQGETAPLNIWIHGKLFSSLIVHVQEFKVHQGKFQNENYFIFQGEKEKEAVTWFQKVALIQTNFKSIYSIFNMVNASALQDLEFSLYKQ